MYVCMYVLMHVYVYVCMYVSMYVCVCIINIYPELIITKFEVQEQRSS